MSSEEASDSYEKEEHEHSQSDNDDDQQPVKQSPTQQIKAAAGVSLSQSDSYSLNNSNPQLGMNPPGNIFLPKPQFGGFGGFPSFGPPPIPGMINPAYPAGMPQPGMMPPNQMPGPFHHPPILPSAIPSFAYKNAPGGFFANAPKFPGFNSSGLVISKNDSVVSNNSQEDEHLVFPGLVKPPNPNTGSQTPDEFLAQAGNANEVYDPEYEEFKKRRYVPSKNQKLQGDIFVCCFTQTKKYSHMSKEEVRSLRYLEANPEGIDVNVAEEVKPLEALKPLSKLAESTQAAVAKPKPSISSGLFGGGLFGSSPIPGLFGPKLNMFPQTGGLFSAPAGTPIPAAVSPTQPVVPPVQLPPSPTNKPQKQNLAVAHAPVNNSAPLNGQGEFNINITAGSNSEFFSMTTTDSWKIQALGEDHGQFNLRMSNTGTTISISYKKQPGPAVAALPPQQNGLFQIVNSTPLNAPAIAHSLFSALPQQHLSGIANSATSNVPQHTQINNAFKPTSQLSNVEPAPASEQKGDGLAEGSLFFNKNSEHPQSLAETYKSPEAHDD